jgi:DNA repair exonuclease SbcCD nuclease subunit
MPKILLTADIHVHPHRNDVRRIEDGLQCLEWIYGVAREHKVDRVVIAGDLLHHRFLLNTYAFGRAYEIINGYGNTDLLLGNHDMLYEDRWDIHSLMAFRDSTTGVRVIEKPGKYDVAGRPVDFLPYTSYPSKYLGEFKDPSPMLVSHLPIADAILNARFDIKSVEDDSHDKEILPASAFHRWKKVMLGHYHYGQRLDQVVEYIGSPMALSFGEADQIKRVAVIDLDTLDIGYVVNKVSPGFHIIDSEEQVKKLLYADNLKNSYVQMRTKNEITAKFDMRSKLEGGGAREIEFVPPKIDIAAQTSTALSKVAAVINNKDKVIDEFVDNCKIPDGLDPALLKKIGKSIVRR